MGWYYTNGGTRESVIAECIANTERTKTIAHSVRGNTLWAVCEQTIDGKSSRFIACFLLQSDRGSYGYKPMDETCGPNQLNCPLSFLDLAPNPAGGYATAWRERVRAWHAQQKTKRDHLKRLAIGQVLELVPGCNPPRVTITSVKPLRGEYNGCVYKVPPRVIPNT